MNVDKARVLRVMERITEENLNMATWAKSPQPEMTCGTTMCFAGHVVAEAGYKLDWRLDPGVVENGWYAHETVEGKDIELLAAELLGMDRALDAARIFYATDIATVDELWERVTEVTGVERPVPVS